MLEIETVPAQLEREYILESNNTGLSNHCSTE